MRYCWNFLLYPNFVEFPSYPLLSAPVVAVAARDAVAVPVAAAAGDADDVCILKPYLWQNPRCVMRPRLRR